MQSSEDTIKALQQAIAKEDLNQILKLSGLLVKGNPQDLEYRQCYAIAAIKAKAFAELSTGMFKQKPQEKGLQRIYYYFLYASGQYKKCVDILKGTKDQGLQLLLAQAYFNVLDYEKSMQLMSDLLKVLKLSQDDKELYMVNMLAASTPQQGHRVKDFQFLITENSCKEIFYNFALFLYSIGDNQTAVKYLNSFEAALQKDDEIDRVTVRLFKDYITLKNEGISESTKQKKIQQYRTLLKTVNDQNLRCVINSNLIYLSGNSDLAGDQYRNLEQLNDPKVKISLAQSIALRLNKLSYLNKKSKINQSTKMVNELDEDPLFKSSTNLLVNKYYALKKNKDNVAAEKLVRGIMQENDSLGFCLLVDLFQDLGDTKSIADSLQVVSKQGNEYAKNYIFSLLIKDSNLFLQYSGYLDEVIEKTTEIKTLQLLLKIYTSKQDQQKQIKILEKIIKLNPKHSNAKICMSEIYLQMNNIEAAENLLRGIEKPAEITDLSYLQYIEKNIHFSKKEDMQAVEEQKKSPQKKRIKKKKRVRLPKGVATATAGFKADPQRWLPKWQRKGYKKKGKKGGNKTQGLSTVGMEEKNVYNAGNSTSAKQVTKEAKKRR